MSTGPDRIVTTVEAALDDASVSSLVANLKDRLLSEMRRQAPAARALGAFPTVTGKEFFETGGKTFEVSGKAGLVVRKGEFEESFTASIREIEQSVATQQKIAIADLKKRLAQQIKFARAEARVQKEAREAFEQTVVPFGDLESSGAKLRKEIDSERAKQHKKEVRDRQREFAVRHKAAQEAFQTSFVNVGELETSSAAIRKALDAEHKKEVQLRQKEFKVRHKAAQEAFQASFMDVNDFEKTAKRFSRDMETDRRRAKIANDERMRQQRLNFQNQMLSVASAGIGIFGTAGFPLLNIGFAAMSGGPMGAGIAAASTAIGEFSRRMNQLADDTMSTSKELGFVSTNFKLAEARIKAISGFAGFGVQASEMAAMKIRGETRQSAEGQDWLRFWSDIRKTVGTQFEEAMLKPFSNTRTNIWDTWSRQREESLKGLSPENLQSARRNMIMAMSGSSPGIEFDPYQMWIRAQNAALDFSKAEELRLQQEALKKIDEQIAEQRRTNQILEGQGTWIPEHIRRLDPARTNW